MQRSIVCPGGTSKPLASAMRPPAAEHGRRQARRGAERVRPTWGAEA